MTAANAQPTSSAAHTTDDFDAAAGRYDLLTRLNPGYHRALAASARDLVSALRLDQGPLDATPGQAPTGSVPELSLLDLGCGSGASTAALVAAAPGARVLGVDASAGMLAQARRRAWPAGVEFQQATAQQLVEVCAEREQPPFDGCLAAYLFRNIPEGQRDRVLSQLRGLIRPGGWLVAQDYATPTRSSRAVWSAVCRGVVVPLSVLVGGHPAIYRYLHHSVLVNDTPKRFMQRLAEVGFTDIATRTTPVGGWDHGILHTVVARVPQDAR